MFKRVIFGDKRGNGAMDLRGIEEIVFAIFDDGVNLRVFKEVLTPDVVAQGGGDDGDDGGGEESGKGKGKEKERDVEMGGMEE